MAIPTPVSFWKFDESSGDAADAVGVNTLTNKSTTPYVSAKINNGAQVTSAATRGFSITDAAQVGLENAGSFSVSIWMNPTTLADNILMGKYGTAGQRSWRLEQNSDAGSTFYFGVSADGSTIAQVSWAGGLSTSTWYHIVVTWAASTSKANLYINNVVQVEKTTTGVTSLFNGTSPFSVGMDAVTGNYSNAIWDAAGFWTSVLTAGDVSDLYNGGSGVQYPFTSTPKNTSSLLLFGVGQ